MAIAPLPLPPGAQARALLHHLLAQGDVVGRDTAGRTIIQLAVDDRVLETLMSFDADAAELEPEPDDEEDGPPVLVDFVRPKVIRRGRSGHAGPRPTEGPVVGSRHVKPAPPRADRSAVLPLSISSDRPARNATLSLKVHLRSTRDYKNGPLDHPWWSIA